MTGDLDRRLRAHRRTELHVNWHGRDLRIVVFSWGIACSCRPGVDTYDCEHVAYARRVLDEPCRVAVDRILALRTAHDVTTPEGIHEIAVAALRLAEDAARLDDQRISHAMWARGDATDNRSQDDKERDAVRLLEGTHR